MTVVHPLRQGWVSTGGTGAQNYDEFADDAEITAIIADRPHSALGVEMPHRAPDRLGSTFTDALPGALTRLRAAQDRGAYRRVEDVVGVYRITRAGATTYGLFAMVDTDQISTRADQPGLVIRNEDVFPGKVTERVALIEATGHLLSAVLLLQTGSAAALRDALAEVCRAAGEADARDTDHAGGVHEVFLVSAAGPVERLCALAGGGELLVADGNHRSLAAQTAGLDRFLAVISTPDGVDLAPYHRLIAHWPDHLPPAPQALAGLGGQVSTLDAPAEVPEEPGRVHLHTLGGGYVVRLPVPAGSARVDRMDHAALERTLVTDLLGWDAGDPRIGYVGGDYPASWLRAQVDQGRADVAVLIAPVPVEDFVAVNLDRAKMPRKSTWFIPKARAGLLLAQVRD